DLVGRARQPEVRYRVRQRGGGGEWATPPPTAADRPPRWRTAGERWQTRTSTRTTTDMPPLRRRNGDDGVPRADLPLTPWLAGLRMSRHLRRDNRAVLCRGPSPLRPSTQGLAFSMKRSVLRRVRGLWLALLLVVAGQVALAGAVWYIVSHPNPPPV